MRDDVQMMHMSSLSIVGVENGPNACKNDRILYYLEFKNIYNIKELIR